MKKYRFYIIIGILLLLYTLLTIYRPRQLNWNITLEQQDKNPYGAYILYRQLDSIFPSGEKIASRLTVYNQVINKADTHSVYLLIEPSLNLQEEDVKALWHYISAGNNAFIATADLDGVLADSLKLKISSSLQGLGLQDSVHIHFTNAMLATDSGYYFRKFTLNNYFSKMDTGRTEVLGTLGRHKPNFIRLKIGKGFLYLHASPLCFSNYFMLFHHNSDYTAAALSYLPKTTTKIYWDEYYKIGPEYSGNILTYFLTHRYLRWAWWLALLAMVLYMFFESKRRQRVIPEMDPMTNTSLDFVKTIGNLYFNAQNNKNIAEKKITYFLAFVRSRLYLSTSHLNPAFIDALSQKSEVDHREVTELINMLIQVETSNEISDKMLSLLNNKIDNFYKQVK